MNEFVHLAGPPRRPRARAILPLLSGGLVAAGTVPLFMGTADAGSTLGASAAEKGRCFGAAVGTYKFSNSTYMSVLNREFHSAVAENEMKWDATEPQQGVFNHSGDRIVSHSRANGMSMRGHTLLRHAQQPGWARGLSGGDLRNAAINHVTALVAIGAGSASAASVDPSAWCVLVNRNSGKALDVHNLATNDGGRIILSLPWRMG
ncbi:endo-1,4-beta-xylanase [Streptomyces sp. NPDC092370]|uniref:endo-1,4-beta-xylanase n=1 Tax=Streptomyces sp. NPDC092370 TaxID=3366016 RepID=UPI00380F7731